MQNNTVWLDISELKNWSGSFTGIQRVVYNVGKDLYQGKDINVKLCRFDYRRKSFVETEYEFIEHVNEKPTVAPNVVPKSSPSAVIKKLLPRRVKVALKSVISYTSPPYVSLKEKIDFKDGDTLFIAGAFWTGQLEGVRKLQEDRRLKVIAFMYDMVPAIMPQLCTQVTDIDFNREIKKAIRLVDSWVCISENTKKDLINYAKEHKIEMKSKQNVVVRLGSDINVKGDSRSPFTKKNQPKEFLLFVSTLEARKNHQLVYQAVKLAEEKGVKLPTIVFAGKHGWHADDLVAALNRDESIKDKLVWLRQVDDSNLRWLYQNCLFTLYPSLYEGWGLPVDESIAYNKFCIASSSSSIPEIAGDMIDYVSPYDANAMLEKIVHYVEDRAVLKKRSDALKALHQTTWNDAALVIKEQLIKL